MQGIQGQSQAQLRMPQQNEVLDSGERILSTSGSLDTVCRAQQLVSRNIAEFLLQQRSDMDLTARGGSFNLVSVAAQQRLRQGIAPFMA